MNITIFGTGYVGLVSGVCLAEVGHQVVCVDVDAAKVDGLNRGVIPIYESGLESMVKANHGVGRLQFTPDAASAIAHGEVIFVAVGTPPDEDGSADLQYVLAVAQTIGQHLAKPAMVVNKSTVPVGTADKMRAAIAVELAARGVSVPFEVVSNPEFLKEGDAINDCMRPDRIVVGADNARAVDKLRSPNFFGLKQMLADGVVFNGRNLYQPEEIESAGVAYYGMGRGRSRIDVPTNNSALRRAIPWSELSQSE